MKKVLSLFLALTLVLILMTPNTAEAAVKISKTKATLEIDATLTLNITGTDKKVKWSTSDKSIAIINNSGTVKAKKEGQATITATVSNKKYTCAVKVVNSNKNTYNEEMSAGEYLVGDDIPAGIYNLECTNGMSWVFIYKNSKDYERDAAYYKYIPMAAKDSIDYEMFPNLYTPTYRNLKLKDGYYLVIDKAAVVFTSK